ncbi:sarcinarray family MAST domain-containing protein [Methanolobus sp. WCC4]|uniref:sarcinarray family MAST domain-containing protein n=1 Tax=Methanolobus sp. WCC4 TaxID=3125784 RepID=UPI0030F53F5F
MLIKTFFAVITCVLLLSVPASCGSPYFEIDVYYNGQLYEETSTPKPLVKIGEPFTLRFDVTMNQECQAVVELSDLGNGVGVENFVVVEGPSKLGQNAVRIFSKNETHSYEWTLKATENWAGGSMPINFIYSAVLKGESESLFNGEFTAAYVTISEEHYDGPVTTEEPTGESSSEGNSPSTPAFSALTLVFVLLVVCVLRKSHY